MSLRNHFIGSNGYGVYENLDVNNTLNVDGSIILNGVPINTGGGGSGGGSGSGSGSGGGSSYSGPKTVSCFNNGVHITCTGF